MTTDRPALHIRIDWMLTEARVILPGAQALLAFQFIVTMSKRFADLPHPWQVMHFVALGFLALAVLLLIAPAALHRVAFAGDDDERFLDMGSRIVTVALAPLALAIATDLTVAAFVLFERANVAIASGAVALVALLAVWFAIPWRMSKRAEP
jgi:Family of unknown function (DUF6328)